jgi:hypothetical protein
VLRFFVVLAGAAVLAAPGLADAPPVGPLPKGPTTAIRTQKGELVSFALPHRAGGRAWRVARQFNARVVRQVSEADVGASVVLVFKAVGKGTTTVSFGLTRGETAKAYESRRFVVTVR